MPEMKNSFQKGRMNKDLDERIVPVGEYRDALNVEVSTSEDSNIGTLQTIKGNLLLEGQPWGGSCVGSIANNKSDKLYFFVVGEDIRKRDLIIEYDSITKTFAPVCVDNNGVLGFVNGRLITGINIIDDMLFWTDNYTEPKRINILRGKAGSINPITNLPDYVSQTRLMVKDTTTTNEYTDALDDEGSIVPIQEKHLVVIRQGPPAAPVLEMVDTEHLDDDMDGERGGYEIHRPVKLNSIENSNWLTTNGEFKTSIMITVHSPDLDGDYSTFAAWPSRGDFVVGDIITIYALEDPSVKVRLEIIAGGFVDYTCTILSGDKDINSFDSFMIELEQPSALFEFKLPRFAYRYKYEDGEYSPYSPFTQPAFLPGSFNYLPKEGYNLGMVNRVRKLAIKDFVHTRYLPEDVVSIDILYKESNSPNVYSVKTIKKRNHDPVKWDEWNAVTSTTTIPGPTQVGDGWAGKTKGYMPITSEMIHATLPANQLLRPWDNVPRKALSQEIVGNRLVYGNYLQNYNLERFGEKNIKVNLHVKLQNWPIDAVLPEEVEAGPNIRPTRYNPAKSIKSLRTYQLGVVYIDKYGRETPVFSDSRSQYSIRNKKENAVDKTNLQAALKNNPPSWATHFKYFIKETSNEYYNLAMDRWYDAEDGNIWLSFPSAERNKVDEETFLILKKEHDNSNAVSERARYKILAISNEAPRFIKLTNNIVATVQDDGTVLGPGGTGFPLVDGSFISIPETDYISNGMELSLDEKGISNCFLRVISTTHTSNWYQIKSVGKDGGYRKITVKTRFKDDMGHTSPDGSWAARVTSCKLEIARRSEENKAEFDGRFFAKILKDNTLITRLGINLTPTSTYQTSIVKKVQYIDPTTTQAPGTGGWFGKDNKKLSIDSKITTWWSRPGAGNGSMGAGDGPDYWKMASKDNSNTASNSSGWFIDKVEAYRPFTGAWGGKSIGKRWNTGGIGNSVFPSMYDQPPNMLNVMALDIYNTPTFLDTSGFQQVASPENTIYDANKADGGKVADSLGIDKSASIINISYSGIQENNFFGAYPSESWDALSTHWFDSSVKHVDDILFITKLTTPGTLWQWKEDPGDANGEPIIYKTIAPPSLSTTSSPYTQESWDIETIADPVDGNKGVVLFNYANFVDYILEPHHQYFAIYNCAGSQSNYLDKRDWVSRDIDDHENTSCVGCLCAIWATTTGLAAYSPQVHDTVPGAGVKQGNNPMWNHSYPEHYKFPMGIYDWDIPRNKRRRFVIHAETAGLVGQPKGQGVGTVGPHYYLPTNDCNLPSHFDVDLNPITTNPVSSVAFDASSPAPGIRPDGMYTGHDHPGGGWQWNDGTQIKDETKIPDFKRWDSDNNETKIPGSVSWRILEAYVDEGDGESTYSSTNPAIWETEPKEDVGLDIYHEIGQIYPIYLNDDTIEQFVGAIGLDISKNSYVECWDPPYSSVPGATASNQSIIIKTNTSCPSTNISCAKDIRVSAAYNNFVQLSDVTGVILGTATSHVLPTLGSYLIFWRADGSSTQAHVKSMYADLINGGMWFELSGNINAGDIGVHNKKINLPWFNCYSFGNGVESDRIRDDFNQVTIDNGPKASTTIEGSYLEDRRKSGFIWSGIYNSTSGVNNLNQFIQAEAITKDVNPSYGSIQKLSVRDSDLVAFCEDRVLKIFADKDALYNADGNTNVVTTNKVLGTARPFVGDYGISKNPESFASDSYRSYFTDTSRGAVIRLSQDGLTPISSIGMKDWFADNLPMYTHHRTKIIGSFDDKKQEYNITLNSELTEPVYTNTNDESTILESKTLSYSENSSGWVSFKSFNKESGVSLNNSYYTLNSGKLYEHHVNETRNNFYDKQFDSSVDVLLNQFPSIIKSFSTLNYEGSQSRVTQDTLTNPDYYDNNPKDGWYVKEMTSNAQELGEMEFWDKEDKWFSQIKGVKTQWLDDGTAGNIDPREFSYQGIGNAGGGVTCINCPKPASTWDCIPGYYDKQRQWVPARCEEITTFPSNGQFSSLSDCEKSCLKPSTWSCVTARPSGSPENKSAGIPVNYCVEMHDGSGIYTSLGDCQTNCRQGRNIDSWNCSGKIPGKYPAYTCYDPGDGSGTYLSFSDCQNNCSGPVIMVGKCDVTNATPYDSNSSYNSGDVIEYLGHYYFAISDILANASSPSIINSQWSSCTGFTSGPCNLGAALPYDENINYPTGTVVEFINTMGVSEWYYNTIDVLAVDIHKPGGPVLDPTTNTTNPWVPCSGVGTNPITRVDNPNNY